MVPVDHQAIPQRKALRTFCQAVFNESRAESGPTGWLPKWKEVPAIITAAKAFLIPSAVLYQSVIKIRVQGNNTTFPSITLRLPHRKRLRLCLAK